MAEIGVRIDRDGPVMTVCFDRPDRRNALRRRDLCSARDAVRAAADDPTVRVVVITGAGDSFSSGADLTEPVRSRDGQADTRSLEAACEMAVVLTAMRKPVVSVVPGPAVGIAAAIALSADLVVACGSAFFCLPQSRLALHPDGGAGALLPAAIGRARAMRMVMLGERISAAMAFDWGLVSHLTTDEELKTVSTVMIQRLAAGPTMAYAEAKIGINAQSIGGLSADIDRERTAQTRLADTLDFREAVVALRDQRVPLFRGR